MAAGYGPGEERYFAAIQRVKEEMIKLVQEDFYVREATHERMRPLFDNALGAYKQLDVLNPEGAPGQGFSESIGFEPAKENEIKQIQFEVSAQLTNISEETQTYHYLNKFVEALNANRPESISAIAAKCQEVREAMAASLGGESTLPSEASKLVARFWKQWEKREADDKTTFFAKVVAARSDALKSAGKTQIEAANLLSSVSEADTLPPKIVASLAALSDQVSNIGKQLNKALKAEEDIKLKSQGDSADSATTGLVNSSNVTMPETVSILSNSPALVSSRAGALPSMRVREEQSVPSVAPALGSATAPGLPIMMTPEESPVAPTSLALTPTPTLEVSTTPPPVAFRVGRWGHYAVVSNPPPTA